MPYFAHLPAGPPTPPLPKQPGRSDRPRERCASCGYRLDAVLIAERRSQHPNCEERNPMTAPPPSATCPWCGGPGRGACVDVHDATFCVLCKDGQHHSSGAGLPPVRERLGLTNPLMRASEAPTPAPITADEYRARLRADLMAVWGAAVNSHGRSQQRELGPSEIGNPCKRQNAYKLLGVAKANTADPAASWPSWLGIQAHDGMERAIRAADPSGERWRTELRLAAPGLPAGSTDLLDLRYGGIIDHKFVGKGVHDRARRGQVAEQYEIQADIYGLHCDRMGVPIRFVAIVFWPRVGNRAEPVLHVREWSRERAEKALADHAALVKLTQAAGLAALQVLPAVEHFCRTCPFYGPGSTDVTRACPGAPTAAAKQAKRDGVHDLIAPGQPGAWPS